MKRTSVLFGLVLWLASVGTAYYVGEALSSGTGAPEADRSTPPPDAKAAVAEVTPPPDGNESAAPTPLPGAILALSETDLDAALRQSQTLDPAATRSLLTEAFALPQNDFRRGRLIRELLGQLAATDPEKALSWAEQIGSLRETERARSTILEVWGRNDPEAALIWARQALANEPQRTRESQMLAIFRGYAAGNPAAAFTAARLLPSDDRTQRDLQREALEEIVEAQIENGGLAAARLQVEQLEDGPLKADLMREMVDEWASFDPEGAAAYVESLGDAATPAMQTALLSEWAENDPAAAAAWLSGREANDEILGRASAAIIRQWTRYDLAASAEWLNSMPDSPELDRAVMSYTYRAAEEDPASAMTWAESINNDWMRTRMMERVASTWKEDDPEGFQVYLDQADLTEEQRAALQDPENFHRGRGWR